MQYHWVTNKYMRQCGSPHCRNATPVARSIYKWSFLIVFIAFKTIYKHFIHVKDLHSVSKKKFGKPFDNRTAVSPVT